MSPPSLTSVLSEELRLAVARMRRLQEQLEEIGEARARMVAVYPKVAEYVKLHYHEGLVKDELTRAERKVCDMAKRLTEIP